jgi:hypothetical protein
MLSYAFDISITLVSYNDFAVFFSLYLLNYLASNGVSSLNTW